MGNLSRNTNLARNIVHILVACSVTLSSPSASLVRSYCDLSGVTSLTVHVVETGHHADACCPEETGAQSLTSSVSDCCQSSVFSLSRIAPVPTQHAADGAVFLVPSHVVTRSDHVVTLRMTPGRRTCVARSLPLLV